MKQKWICALLMATPCLTSCGGSSIYGSYEFRLGKTDGSHIGLMASLKNEEYASVSGAKKMSLSAELGDDFSLKQMLSDYVEKYPFLEDFITRFADEFSKVDHIDGYYTVTSLVDEKFGTRLRIGSDFISDVLKAIFPEMSETVNLSLPPELIEQVAAAYVNNKNLTFTVPVSTSDLQQQLFWYGTLIDTSNSFSILQSLDMDRLPGKKDETRLGSHPTADEVAAVNKEFAFEFSHTPLYQIDEENVDKLGVFVVKENEEGQRRLFLRLLDGVNVNRADFKATVLTRSLWGGYEDDKAIRLSLGENDELIGLQYNNLSGKEEGFKDLDGNDFTFDSFMREPFVFRDFHNVNVSLTKM